MHVLEYENGTSRGYSGLYIACAAYGKGLEEHYFRGSVSSLVFTVTWSSVIPLGVLDPSRQGLSDLGTVQIVGET